MQLMCDALAVTGSRHGILFNPADRKCGIIRFDRFTRLPDFHLRAGVIIEGQEYCLPLAGDAHGFDFVDQRITPCTSRFIGIHAASATRLTLTVTVPFRPGDAQFSTAPVMLFNLQIEALGGQFRWTKRSLDLNKAVIFLEWQGESLQLNPHDQSSLDLEFTSVRGATHAAMEDVWQAREEHLPQSDRLLALNGKLTGTRFEQEIDLKQKTAGIEVCWCTWSNPVMEVQGRRLPFKYTQQFNGLDAVAAWARENAAAITENAAGIDTLTDRPTLPVSAQRLMAQTLHSWMVNTWWAVDGERDWFSVWEGCCYFHSTVDVEYTQAPFYLVLWPELLRIQLDWWPEFELDGARTLGDAGTGTAYLSHDMGAHATANGQIYSHDMPVEEAANYLILAFVYWQRTGDASVIKKHGAALARYAEFLIAADSTGDGIPDQGVANTIDDASPAIQFGRKQVYLAVKTLAALIGSGEMLALLKDDDLAPRCKQQADRIRRTICEKGWAGDHFTTLTEPGGRIMNPWTGEEEDCTAIPGWDAPHIYTVNGLALMDMVGVDCGLPRERLIRDLQHATRACLREYGCAHSNFRWEDHRTLDEMQGLAGMAANPGWISMNMLRDIAGFYRGLDFRGMAERYWEWQVATNTHEVSLFFETFAGNQLRYYPRGVAIWGWLDALEGRVINRVRKIEHHIQPFNAMIPLNEDCICEPRPHSFCTAINCMDGRTQDPVNTYLKELFGVCWVDEITEPGPIRILAEQQPQELFGSIIKRLEISLYKHESKALALVAHADCAGNPEPEEVQYSQIKQALANMRALYPDIKIIALWVDEALVAHEVDG